MYRRLGAWVDIYDDKLDPTVAVKEMARRGVKTLYLETNNFHSRGEPPGTCAYGPDVDILYPETVAKYLEVAHQKGIAVVAWYVPGFADLDRDIRRSMAAINFTAPGGEKFDGFAADIETRGEFGCKGVTGDEQRTRFNAAIVEYTTRLRDRVGPERVLGAIVVDAKNNEKAPKRWEGFPWKEIGAKYDVILPMAYWSAAKPNGDCSAAVDTVQYMKDVVAKTNALMATTKPLHLIGGIANCILPGEVAGYVDSAKALGSIGGGLYDFATTEESSSREAFWEKLIGFNS